MCVRKLKLGNLIIFGFLNQFFNLERIMIGKKSIFGVCINRAHIMFLRTGCPT